ncbi:hypothetical protein FH966_10380 [Lentibacillus cibarius]|uniref:PucR family transcriptional regulator n=1 Tax=Lentibacillus cibarius TaxID=2583219 RepID=A0A549YJM1_9BACI|nr:PucR family transcriptional regulator [Lentibacillus cibarius]RYG71326.1 PucR family transcriptional regulator [Lentibacillus lipolyticus]TRM12054.1 hypothetical protein FH966_10380 [Lentibacillus cibarius]
MFAVKDILKRPQFHEAKILTGKNGLHRKVKWVHVVEIDNFGHLLNGQEVILTTGLKWVNDETRSIHFLQQLLEQETSALCIELAEHSRALPEKMLTLAEENNFPIIAFNKEVKFVDITRDLHETILEYQENSWWDLDGLYKKLHHTLVSNQPISEFLKQLHQATNKQIALIQNKKQIRFFPSPSKRKQQQWMEQIEQDSMPCKLFPIYFLEKEIAQLYILEEDDDINLFDEISAKRCSELLEQYFWKHYQNNEMEQIKQNEWLLEALYGSLPKKQIAEEIYQNNPSIKINEAIVGVIPNINNSVSGVNHKDFITDSLMFLRSFIEEKGCYLLTTNDTLKNCYVLLLINQQENGTLSEQLKEIKEQLRKSNHFNHNDIQWISFGKIISTLEQLQQGYQTALTTLNYQSSYGSLPEPFYDNLGVYRLIDQMEDIDELQEMIKKHIGPLISHDHRNGTELLKTLQIYLKNMGSKNDTARDLYIVRQTLYHRLDRIKELLGEDFMDYENRIMVELSMHLLKYVDIKERELASSL